MFIGAITKSFLKIFLNYNYNLNYKNININKYAKNRAFCFNMQNLLCTCFF